MSVLGDQILQLRSTGMSYKAIAKAIPCSLGTVAYFLGSGQREKSAARTRKRRRTASAKIKDAYGGKCSACGYDRCTSALEFDHLDPKQKSYTISSRRSTIELAIAEAAKCILLCCRCHRERHAGLLDIGPLLEPDL